MNDLALAREHLSFDDLRERVQESGAAQAIVDVTKALTASEFEARATDAQLMEAFNELSVAHPTIREKLHRHPFPDFARLGIYTGDTPAYHLAGGFHVAYEISRRAAKYGKPLGAPQAMLDFGCGTSRVLRFLVEYMPRSSYFGSEVFKDVVEWGRSAFPEVSYIQQQGLPPLPLEDGSLDVVYAYSIWSHFNAEVGSAWLDEMHRVLRPGGLIIFTIQSRTLLDRTKQEPELAARLSMTDKDIEKVDAEYQRDGFAFHRCYDEKSLADGGLDAATFGLAYISRTHMEREWSRWELLEHDEGAIAKFQDWVVMRKPA